MSKDVAIYSGSGKIPVLKANKIELIKSQIFRDILKSLNICDGCRDPVSIIVDGETEVDIFAALCKVTHQTGVSIIRGVPDQKKVADLLQRLGFLQTTPAAESDTITTSAACVSFATAPGTTGLDPIAAPTTAPTASPAPITVDIASEKSLVWSVSSVVDSGDEEINSCNDPEQPVQTKSVVKREPGEYVEDEPEFKIEAIESLQEQNVNDICCEIENNFSGLKVRIANDDIKTNIWQEQNKTIQHCLNEDKLPETQNKNLCGECLLDERFGHMIQCSRTKCSQWHHLNCAGLDEEKREEYERDTFEWFCNSCKVYLTNSEFMCSLCSEVLINQRSAIYSHYALHHFRREMEKIIKCFGTFDSKVCRQCGNRSKAIKAHIYHTAVVHGHIEKVLPNHLQIQKISTQTFKKLRQMLYGSIPKVKKMKRSLKKPSKPQQGGNINVHRIRGSNTIQNHGNLFQRKVRIDLVNCNRKSMALLDGLRDSDEEECIDVILESVQKMNGLSTNYDSRPLFEKNNPKSEEEDLKQIFESDNED